MEDAKEDTPETFEEILQTSIDFFKKEGIKNLKYKGLNYEEEKQAIEDSIKRLSAIEKVYKKFKDDKTEENARLLKENIAHLKSKLTDAYNLEELLDKGKLFETLVKKYKDKKYILTITSENTPGKTGNFRNEVKLIKQEDIDEEDNDGTKLSMTGFQKFFMGERTRYYENKSKRDTISKLIDNLDNKIIITQKILDDAKEFFAKEKEKKDAAESIISIFRSTIVNKELAEIENFAKTAKGDINNIEDLYNKQSYYDSIDKIKMTGIKLYFEGKINGILALAKSEIIKKGTIQEIETVATNAKNNLDALNSQTTDAIIKTLIKNTIATIEESKNNKIQVIEKKEIELLRQQIDDNIKEIYTKVTEKFAVLSSQIEIDSIVSEAKEKLEALKSFDKLSTDLQDKLADTIRSEITKIDDEIKKIEKEAAKKKKRNE